MSEAETLMNDAVNAGKVEVRDAVGQRFSREHAKGPKTDA